MFSLSQLVREIKRLGCPDSIAHTRMIRNFFYLHPLLTDSGFQVMVACNPACPVPENIIQDIALGLNVARRMGY